jgi:hypothetical protein
MVGLSSTLQSNIEELEQTTEEIQSQISEIEAAPAGAPESQEWDNVNDLLEDVNAQLESIEENMDSAAIPGEEVAATLPTESDDAESQDSVRARADQVFTIFAVLAGLAAIAIAILLGMAMRVQENRLPV